MWMRSEKKANLFRIWRFTAGPAKNAAVARGLSRICALAAGGRIIVPSVKNRYNVNMTRIIVFIIGTVAGVALIWKTEWFIQNIGKSAWAEDKMGMAGGSRTLYKLIGLLVIFFCWIYAFGMLEGCLAGTLGQVMPGLKKQ
jgi:hypothetical protein